MKLISVSSLKDYLELTAEDKDEVLATIIQQISGQIESELGFLLTRAVRVEKVHPVSLSSGYSFYLHNLPVDLTQVITLVNASQTYVYNTDFIVDADTGYLSLIGSTPFTYYDYPSIVVTYTAGFTLSEDGAEEGTDFGLLAGVDDSLKRACMMQSVYEYKHRDDLGLAGVSMAGASVQLAPAKLLPIVTDIIASYQRGPFRT